MRATRLSPQPPSPPYRNGATIAPSQYAVSFAICALRLRARSTISMPGANYMGGKRNAARARVKDATGQAQRSHFGKKRFEILRTGLSKGHATTGQSAKAGNGPHDRPEISLAHARRNFRPAERSNMIERLLSPYQVPTPRPSSPRSPTSRSRILKALDADSPIAQRARVSRILQIPDLLGLSTAQTRPLTLDTNHSDTASPQALPRRSTSIELAPSTYSRHSSSFEPVHSSGTSYRLPRPPSPNTTDFSFTPMHLDSSPPPYINDSGYVGSSSAVYDHRPSYLEAPRTPFYATSSPEQETAPRGIPTALPWGPHTTSAPSTHAHSRSAAATDPSYLSCGSGNCKVPEMFLSDLPVAPSLIDPGLAGSLPPSESSGSGHYWLSRTSHLPDSDEIPQASFSLSPPAGARAVQSGTHGSRMSSHVDMACDAGYSSADGSMYSLLGEASSMDSQDMNPAEWQQTSLAELLNGALFEGADPWRALDDILDLPSSLVDSPLPFVIPSDVVGSCNPCDRSGVGYLPPIALSSKPSLSVQPSLVSQTAGNPAPGSAEGSYPADLEPAPCSQIPIADTPNQSPDVSHVNVPVRFDATSCSPEPGMLPGPDDAYHYLTPGNTSPAALDPPGVSRRRNPGASEVDGPKCTWPTRDSPALRSAETDLCRSSPYVLVSQGGEDPVAPGARDGGSVDGPSLFLDDELIESD
ncbi:hypothetical protein C8Q77DRAFT_1099052 [Trametes polyzona]|nr:hypothetical protein C8Q77DRAFT_1099052 [Trametes polyzona]